MADIGAVLLGMLVDKYERSSEFRTGKPSNRRILMKLYDNGKCDFAQYNIEQSETRLEINRAVEDLNRRGLLYFKWMRQEEHHILSQVWLNIDNIDAVYAYLHRKPKGDVIDGICLELLQAIDESEADWAKAFLKDTYDTICSKRTVGNRLPADMEERQQLLKCICFASRLVDIELLERVFSIRCFGNSKTFEKTVKSRFTSILRKHLDADENAKDEDLLQQIGIVKYPEQFEFCGNLTIENKGKEINFSNLRYGAAIFSSELVQKTIVLPAEIQAVISIENRANYIDFIDKHKKENQLVLYHGGQYSPAKKQFFQMVAHAMSQDAKWFHWGDIDYGGFSMLARLRREIKSNVTAYRMGIDELIEYERLCASFQAAYAKKLEQLLPCEELQDCGDCIHFMLDNRRRLEQEALLTV